jgi:hypothetical protein
MEKGGGINRGGWKGKGVVKGGGWRRGVGYKWRGMESGEGEGM